MSCMLIFISKENEHYGRFKIILFSIIFFIIIISEMSLRYVAYSNYGLMTFIFFPILLFLFTYIFLMTNLRNRF